MRGEAWWRDEWRTDHDSQVDVKTTTPAAFPRPNPMNFPLPAGSMSGREGAEGTQASAAKEWQSHSNMKASLCRVVGCCVDLSALGKPYCLKRREWKGLKTVTACHGKSACTVQLRLSTNLQHCPSRRGCLFMIRGIYSWQSPRYPAAQPPPALLLTAV